eukprot:CAMPEP_0116881678 /NCGR_PEP_ID=MMETSP0463-20121206/13756_1 /TAXON_ID=181622 /ORGANISM="Strombidinopsis sp, Strain SopsisLIS2011" /LENGTH=77 /DNA_ID=CAMNT_0004533795 /DNA_START=43 /DNA_END=273 /DNA_ORIENTATION=+
MTLETAGKILSEDSCLQPDGVDVAEGLKVDYSGKENTPENFIAVLTGDSKTTGGLPVLKSDSNSKVFVYFADHGAPG